MTTRDPGIAPLLEAADAAAARDLVAAADPRLARALGVRATPLDGATAVAASHLDVLAYNRVIGLGLDHPATDSVLDRAIAWYQACDIPRFFVQLSPYAAPSDLPGRLAARGLAHYNNWMKLWRRTDPVSEVPCDYAIAEAGQEHAEAIGALVTRGFNVPGATAQWIARLIGREGWRHYVALDRDLVVGCGSLYVHRRAGWLGFAATEPACRGRGVQTALITRRIAEARALELDTLVVETAEDRPDRRAPSFHNLRRLGFELAYVRPNYLWTAPPDERPAA